MSFIGPVIPPDQREMQESYCEPSSMAPPMSSPPGNQAGYNDYQSRGGGGGQYNDRSGQRGDGRGNWNRDSRNGNEQNRTGNGHGNHSQERKRSNSSERQGNRGGQGSNRSPHQGVQSSPDNRWNQGRSPNQRYQGGWPNQGSYRSPDQGNQNWSNQETYYRSPDQGGQSYSPGNQYSRREEDSDVFLSKTLSSILRHNAERFGFTLMKGGFLYVDDILHKIVKLRGYTSRDVIRIVESNDKKRFALEKEADGRLKIRANQGHSVQVDDLDLTPITSAADAPVVIHGTYYEAWEYIKETGIRRMNRNHMHFAVGEPGKDGVISGMRSSCEVIIYIDMEKALKDGLKFFRSANNVILSPGNDEGFIYPCYFSGVLDRRLRCRLEVDTSICSRKSLKNDEPKKESKNKKNKNKRKNKQGEEEWLVDESPSPSPKKQASSSVPDDDHKRTEDSHKPTEDSHKPTEDSHKPTEDSRKSANDRHGADATEQRTSANLKEDNTAQTEVTKPCWKDAIRVMDVEQSKCIVDHITSAAPEFIVVCCCGEEMGTAKSHIRLMVILARPDVYIYHIYDDDQKELMTDGQLNKLLMDKKIHKIFHNISEISPSLIHEYDILLDGIPIWDVEMVFTKFKGQLSDEDKVEIKEMEVSKNLFKKWKSENEEYGKKLSGPGLNSDILKAMVERGKMMLQLYIICFRRKDDNLLKKLKGEIYAAAIPTSSDLEDKIKELKLEKKKKEKQESSRAAGNSEASNTGDGKKGKGGQKVKDKKKGNTGRGK